MIQQHKSTRLTPLPWKRTSLPTLIIASEMPSYHTSTTIIVNDDNRSQGRDGLEPATPSSKRKPPHCRTCKNPMKGHKNTDCPSVSLLLGIQYVRHCMLTKLWNSIYLQLNARRQGYTDRLAETHTAMAYCVNLSPEEAEAEAELAEEDGYKTMIVLFGERALLVFGKDGGTVQDLAGLLRRAIEQVKHSTSLSATLCGALSIATKSPIFHKVLEHAVLPLITASDRKKERCGREH